jgi:preprotein translocase subunit SecA
MISKRIEAAQKAVEAQNFESRKHVLEYDDVMNKQREAVYGLRRQLMEGVDQKELVTDDYVSTILSNLLDQFVPEKALPDQWKLDELFVGVQEVFGADFKQGRDAIDTSSISRRELGDAIFDRLRARYDVKEQILSPQQLRYHERVVMLSVLDGLWKEHLLNMDHLKEGIGLRGYAQQDPLVAYKKESFEMFESMMLRFQEDTARHLFRMQVLGPDGQPIETLEQFQAIQAQLAGALGPDPRRANAQQASAPQPAQRTISQELGLEPTQDTLDELASGSREDANAVVNTPVKEMAPPVVPTRPPSTTIDALEREFARKKQRELDAARSAGGSAASGPAQARSTSTVGRNDPCPCGSGKKYKKCHGATA